MRQGQQHRRGRGRNNNNSHNQNYGHNNNHRKGNNPLSRSFESNGPEVKVRGTPAHVAEKYMSLARDAQSAGDPVLAENYLQHAEHYNRIILAYREQQMQQGEMNGGGHRMRPEGGEGDEPSDDQPDDQGQGDQPQMSRPQHEQQPRFNDQQRGGDDRQQNRDYRNHDQGRFRERHDRHERHDRQDRQPQEARQPQEMRQPAQERGFEPQPVIENAAPQPRGENPGRRRERFGPGNEQPEFLRRPVRRPRREASNSDGEDAVEAGRDESQDKTPA